MFSEAAEHWTHSAMSWSVSNGGSHIKAHARKKYLPNLAVQQPERKQLISESACEITLPPDDLDKGAMDTFFFFFYLIF